MAACTYRSVRPCRVRTVLSDQAAYVPFRPSMTRTYRSVRPWLRLRTVLSVYAASTYRSVCPCCVYVPFCPSMPRTYRSVRPCHVRTIMSVHAVYVPFCPSMPRTYRSVRPCRVLTVLSVQAAYLPFCPSRPRTYRSFRPCRVRTVLSVHAVDNLHTVLSVMPWIAYIPFCPSCRGYIPFFLSMP